MFISFVYFYFSIQHKSFSSPVSAALATLLARQECGWVSVTSAGNVYGSDVVKRVLAAGGTDHVGVAQNLPLPAAPELLLAAMDSKSFADLGKWCHA